MNKGEVEERYKKLLEEVKTLDFYTKVDLANRLNVYICDNKHRTITKDIDSGVTPFIIDCPVCNRDAKSVFYRIEEGYKKTLKPQFEWYRPTLEELLKIDHIGTRDHVLQGGLLKREIK